MMKNKSFEDALKELEQIVFALESNSLSLEEAFAKFENGMKLSKYCSEKLDAIEKKVTIITQNNISGEYENTEPAA